MKIKRSKFYIILIVSLCLLVSLGIYKTGFLKKRSTPDPVTLNVSLYKSLPHYDSFEKTVEECWNEKHPDVKLNFVDWDCYSRTLPEDLDNMAILIQHFYGNRTVTFISLDDFDAIMLGNIDTKLFDKTRDREKIDRTIIRIPDTENLVLVYNKYQEEKCLKELQQFIQEINKCKHRFNPSAVIPEMGIVLYSRCIVCRIDEDGALVGLEEEDCPKVVKYLAA